MFINHWTEKLMGGTSVESGTGSEGRADEGKQMRTGSITNGDVWERKQAEKQSSTRTGTVQEDQHG